MSESSRVFDPRAPRSERGQADLAAAHLLQRPTQRWILPQLSRGWIVAGAILCALFALVLQISSGANLLLQIRPHHNQGCRVLPGQISQSQRPVGAEDVLLDRHGIALISADRRRWLLKTGGGLSTVESTRRQIAEQSGGEGNQGAIWAYDARAANESLTAGQLVKLEPHGLPRSIVLDFQPHGINVPRPLEPAADGQEPTQFLYVINHARYGDEVLVFEVRYEMRATNGAGSDATKRAVFPPTLHYRTSIRSPALISANDLETLYPVRLPDGRTRHSMFVSNFLGTGLGNALGNLVEMVATRPWGNVVLCQADESTGTDAQSGAEGEEEENEGEEKRALAPTRCTRAIEGLAGPNGLSFSLNRRFLYLASCAAMTFYVYELPQQTNVGAQSDADSWQHGSLRLLPLSLNESVPTGTWLDNIHLDEWSSDIYIGAHPKPLATGAHQSDPTHAPRAPFQVIRVHVANEEHKRGVKLRTDRPGAGIEVRSTRTALISRMHERMGRAGIVPRDITVDEVMLSDGEQFSGVSAAVFNRATRELIMGGVSDDGIYICPFPADDQILKQ